MKSTHFTFYENHHVFSRLTGKSLLRALIFSVFLLPLSTFAQDATWFTDVSVKTGCIDKNMDASAIIGLDVNNDDYPDLLAMGTTWKLFLNEQRPGSSDPKDRIFVDVTAGSGLDAIALKDLAGAADFNNDGNIDLVTNRWYHNTLSDGSGNPNPDDGSRCHLLLGDGKGHFTLKENSGLEDLGPMAGVGLPALDYDLDGNLDLFIPNHYAGYFINPGPSFLMHGNGDGTFTNVTIPSGMNVSEKDPAKPWIIPPQYRAMFGANVCDWNNDGQMDILTCPYESVGFPETATHCQYQYSNGLAYAPCNLDTQDTRGYGQLFQNNGNGTFTDVGPSKNYDVHFAWADQGMVPWAAMPCDYNNDGNFDFLVLEVHGGNHPANSPTYDWPADPGNGRTCIFTNLGPDSSYRLKPNVGQIVRSPPLSSSHGDHNGIWMDFDNDGWADLIIGDAVYVTATDRMFLCRQDPSTHVFTDITKALGFITSNNPKSINDVIRRPSTMIPMDYDMDGDDDIFKTPYSPDSAGVKDVDSFLVLRNDVSDKAYHVTIKLKAPAGVNKSCIGARVYVTAGGITQMREIYGDQGSFTNQYPFILNFGVGQNKTIDKIDVRWPNKDLTHTVVNNLPATLGGNATNIVLIDENGASDGVQSYAATIDNEFDLYPNPNSGDLLNLKFKTSSKFEVVIYNEFGQEVSSTEFKESLAFLQLPVKNLAPGAYWVHVNGKGFSSTKPFVKVAAQ